MKNTKVSLVPLTADDREQFILDNRSFKQFGYSFEIFVAPTVKLNVRDHYGCQLRSYSSQSRGKCRYTYYYASCGRNSSRVRASCNHADRITLWQATLDALLELNGKTSIAPYFVGHYGCTFGKFLWCWASVFEIWDTTFSVSCKYKSGEPKLTAWNFNLLWEWFDRKDRARVVRIVCGRSW